MIYVYYMIEFNAFYIRNCSYIRMHRCVAHYLQGVYDKTFKGYNCREFLITANVLPLKLLCN